ncbi:helix-turn-helix transcriptional regulator [Actinokineospora terrae]|uniref:Helix-turn-helix domain-containing protein n=1 Tax=Actinokineospora terrae TaxID=155974 RepID=A0A1H9MCD0_9PSEU|nr:helix-turn-helix transcriptional regulator [Actinokineospora terrae]SER21356.1 Helix-turn-helix domain-containing protein [Actinokineospora terrae]
MAQQTDLSTFLRSRRAKVRPADIGLNNGHTVRRTQGLRREEVAASAGVSVDYYTRLEQGRERNPSIAVLESLATTLLLEGEERDHLFRLAAHTGNRAQATPPAPRAVRPAVRQLLDTVTPSPAYVLNRWNDMLAANPAGLALLAGLDEWPPARRNTVRYIFLHPVAPTLFEDWGSIAHNAVAHLHAMEGLLPGAPALQTLVDELSEQSQEFRALWQQHDVRSLSTGRKLLNHPNVGRMALTYEVLDITIDHQRLVIYQAPAGTVDHDSMMLLNLVNPSAETTTERPRRRSDQR